MFGSLMIILSSLRTKPEYLEIDLFGALVSLDFRCQTSESVVEALRVSKAVPPVDRHDDGYQARKNLNKGLREDVR